VVESQPSKLLVAGPIPVSRSMNQSFGSPVFRDLIFKLFTAFKG
jgi:hypothetical protein